ncbi:MAG: DUF3467 domain-containing protein [Clostridiaceae bacterium]|nr:DUF3467 domain-containing protein [Clostridiaceae bacterium]
MVKKNEKELEKKEIEVNIQNRRYDCTFYSNIAQAAKSEVDAYIDFMQFPPVENITPTVRIYLSQTHLKQLFEVLSTLPGISEKGDEE